MIDQAKYPPVSSLAKKAKCPLISPLPLSHRAYVHPIQAYIWLHDLRRAFDEILDITLPDVQAQRLTALEHYAYLEDSSGRSTGKTYEYINALGIIGACLHSMKLLWLGQDKEIGVETFDDILGTQIENNNNFKRFIKGAGNSPKPKVSHTEGGAVVRYHNGSILRTMSPDASKGYKKMRTRRYNSGIYNEWPSWADQDDIHNVIEPIFTHRNYAWRATRMLREATERSLNIPLGRLTDEELEERHRRPDDIPRDHLIGNKADPWDETRENFYYNFEISYGFDYRYGVDHPDLKFKKLRNTNDLVEYFAFYDEGDPVLQNKLIYDGNAQELESPAYPFYEWIGKQVEKGNHLYSQIKVGIDDIPTEYDGIIYDSAKVEKARQSLTKEEFDRVWNGIWNQSKAKRPFTWNELIGVGRTHFYGQTRREKPGERFIGAVDSAQGTDLQYTLPEGMKDARGDDAVSVIWKLGDGTSLHPHELCLVNVMKDVRPEWVAYDIQMTEAIFAGVPHPTETLGGEYWMFDPGGQGKAVIGDLAKSQLSREGKTIDVIPMLPVDHMDSYNGKNSIVFFSLSSELIQAAYIDSKSGKALLKGNDMLNNAMVESFRTAVAMGTVATPGFLHQETIVGMLNDEEISQSTYDNLMNIRFGLRQLLNLKYVTEKGTMKRKKSGNNVFTYSADGKKDAAWTILMGHMLCDIIVKVEQKMKTADSRSSYGSAMLGGG